ncbi:MAG: HAD hydrolase-like protein, partial [Deltaproteobacteria bacterium]|nr:HAD hydrolase-like protein [Deltaproteobacteria bacterium]
TPGEGCSCRKPGTVLIDRATAEFGVDPLLSYVIGDKEVDMKLAENAGAKSVLVLTGMGKEESGKVRPDHVAADLSEAASWIVEDSKE